MERERLGLTQTAMAALYGATKGAQLKWERGASHPDADVLAAFAQGGADVLFIVTGHRVPAPSSSRPAPQYQIGSIIRPALAMLCPASRRQLLLDLLADELRA